MRMPSGGGLSWWPSILSARCLSTGPSGPPPPRLTAHSAWGRAQREGLTPQAASPPAERPLCRPWPASFPTPSLGGGAFLPYAPPGAAGATRGPVAMPAGDGPTHARPAFGPPRRAPGRAAWTRSSSPPTAARRQPSCPGAWPHCPSGCQPAGRPGVPRPPMPPHASWAPGLASIAPRGRGPPRPRPRSRATSSGEGMGSRPLQPKPRRRARADAPCQGRAMTWKRCRGFMCSIGLTPRDGATPWRREMIWRRELPHPHPAGLLSRCVRAAWGGVCL
jgi:hypothetical protein